MTVSFKDGVDYEQATKLLNSLGNDIEFHNWTGMEMNSQPVLCVIMIAFTQSSVRSSVKKTLTDHIGTVLACEKRSKPHHGCRRVGFRDVGNHHDSADRGCAARGGFTSSSGRSAKGGARRPLSALLLIAEQAEWSARGYSGCVINAAGRRLSGLTC